MKQRKTKTFYQHAETGHIVVIEKRWEGTILGSCPASEPLRDLDGYECTDKNNLWLSDNSDKLMLM